MILGFEDAGWLVLPTQLCKHKEIDEHTYLVLETSWAVVFHPSITYRGVEERTDTLKYAMCKQCEPEEAAYLYAGPARGSSDSTCSGETVRHQLSLLEGVADEIQQKKKFYFDHSAGLSF